MYYMGDVSCGAANHKLLTPTTTTTSYRPICL